MKIFPLKQLKLWYKISNIRNAKNFLIIVNIMRLIFVNVMKYDNFSVYFYLFAKEKRLVFWIWKKLLIWKIKY